MHRFAADVERLARRRQECARRARSRDRSASAATGLQDVLAVIEDQQQLLALEPLRNRLVDPAALLLAHAQRLGDDAGDQFRIADRREVDEPHAIGIAIEQLRADLHRQPRLANATRANQREQAVTVEQFFDLGDVVLAADEAGGLNRKIVGQRIERAQRRKLVRKPSMSSCQTCSDCVRSRGGASPDR